MEPSTSDPIFTYAVVGAAVVVAIGAVIGIWLDRRRERIKPP